MSPLLWLLIILAIILLFGGFGGSQLGWYAGRPGYYGPGFGIGGIVLIVVVVLLLSGRF